MKNLSTLLVFFFCLLCQSCQDDNLEGDKNNSVNEEINANPEGLLLDGGEISDISLFCIENNKSTVGEQWYEYGPRIKTVSDYSAFKLWLILNRNAAAYYTSNTEEMISIGKIESDYVKEKSLFIYESYKDYKQSNPVEWPVLFTSYLNGELSITCDKILFGEQPGTNLSPYFTVLSKSPCIPMGVENPKLLYNFGEEIPLEVTRLFTTKTWLQPDYYLLFAKLPSEKYENLTLHISLPMIIEHVRDFAVSKYKGNKLENLFSESVFEADCQIKFNWD